MLLSLLLSVVSPVALANVDERGCGTIALKGAPALGGPSGLCVKQVVWAPLEGGLVAALVEAPHRFDARLRNRVFLYRVEGRRLVPRFLGSGFATLDVDALAVRAGVLALEAHDGTRAVMLECRLAGFPLVCTETP